MIKFLAELFRGMHYVIEISAPPPSSNHRKFVFAWLGRIAFIVAYFVGRFYIMPFLMTRHYRL
jgi:hypothetical protein